MKYKLAIIGTGNVAYHLSAALESAGHVVTEVYGRNLAAAGQLASRLYGTEACDSLDFTESAARIYVLAVSDAAIPDIAEAILLPERSTLLHTSGTLPLDILAYSSADYTGILYPLQSLSKGREIGFEEVPFLLESEEPETLKMLKNICKSLSSPSYLVSSAKRRSIHIAAVFAANFTNHMLLLAESLMRKQGLDFNMLKPLVVEQINKSLQMGARAAQTGPAVRGDFDTLENHLHYLSSDEKLAEIYQVISQNIIDSY